MRHYVLLKFEQGYLNDEIVDYIKVVFDNISEIRGIESVIVHNNCFDRESNMDIMIEMNIRDEEILKLYLNHELHIEFAKKMNDHLISKVSFDCY